MSAAPRLWVQITAGRGPAECARAVCHACRALSAAAHRAGCRTEVLECEADAQDDTARSILLAVEGQGAEAILASWQGTLLWTCASPFRPHHRRKNWYVGVAVLTPPERARELDPRDVAIETFRASGPGGQHVNRTDSAVRARHRPTGLVATAREERSQHANRRLALSRLAALLRDAATSAERAASSIRWNEHDALERGKPIRRFRGPDFAPVD